MGWTFETVSIGETSNGAATDVLEGQLSGCQYPLVCGEYGHCQYGQCSYPQSADSELSHFKPKHIRRPNLGFTHITASNCNASDLHSFVEVFQVGYFTFRVDIQNTDRNNCKKACLANCSCKATMFRYGLDSSLSDRYLPTKIYSLIGIDDDKLSNHNLSINLKIQTTPKKSTCRRNFVFIIIGLTSGSVLVVSITVFFFAMKWKSKWRIEIAEDYMETLPIVLTHFSLKDLKIATCNFSVKIGEGSLGSVFQGSLRDGTRIAVKNIYTIGHTDDSFLTEIGSIGKLHHVNLVRLIGYCSEKPRRLLVYEYMVNGSLDNWLDRGIEKIPLDWNQRKKIMLGIAKGLSYLHEDCRQKIVHLDVKPGNILLDEGFNAKLTVFGLLNYFQRMKPKSSRR